MLNRWESNMKIGFKEIGRAGVGWIKRAEVTYMCRALVNAVMKYRAPYSAGNISTG